MALDISQNPINLLKQLVLIFCRCVKYLVSHGADANAQDDSGRTALHWASGWGHTWCVKMLCQYGKANINLTDHKRESPLIPAVIDGKVGCIEVLN